MSIFSIGVSGLNAAQNALNTTSNNISNVYTPGYNREVSLLGESRGDGGVQVNDVQRQFNRFVADQLNAATSKTSALETYRQQVDQVDSLLADREAGLSPLIQDFFSATEDLASAPSDPAARQGVLGAADTLSAQFRAFDGYLQDLQSGVNGQIRDEVTQINNATDQLANTNREIALARASRGEAPNDLLNQRDQAVADLNERLGIRLNVQDGETYNVTLPNGQPLVTGTNQFDLKAVESPGDPQRTVVGYVDAAGNDVPLDEDLITGGTLGGLTQFRAETLDKTQNQIGQLAVSFGISVNEQQSLGLDLNGETGEPLFNIGEPRAFGRDGNSSDNLISEIKFDKANIDQLRPTDYEVRVGNLSSPPEASDFTVTRTDTGETLDSSTNEVSLDGNALSFGGVSLSFNNVNNLQEGDRFDVQPVRRGARGIESAIADGDKIAAASGIETSGDMDVSLEAAESTQPLQNGKYQLTLQSNGKLIFNDSGEYDDVPQDITVNGETRNVGGSGFVADTETPAGSMKPNDQLVVDGLRFTVNSLPESGDTTLTLEQGSASSGDNRNALELQSLQERDAVGGSATLSGAYASIVSDVGNRTNITQVNLDAQEGLTEQLEEVQQSESGVNLDEEAANLIRYQQFYQANAQVIETGSTILDTILGVAR